MSTTRGAVGEALDAPTSGVGDRTGARTQVTNRRVLGMVAIVAAIVHVAQVGSDGHPWTGVIAFGLAAGFVMGWRLELLRAVRTAVVLIGLLSVACILGTLTVQRSQLSHATPEEFQSTASFAWAHLAIKMTHPFPADVGPTPVQQSGIDDIEGVFGEDLAREESKKLHKSLVANRHEEMARELAAAHPQVFAGLFRLAEGLLLTDVFRAWWFISLFYLLSLNLVVGALVRRKPSVRNLGFHAAHLGLVLVVLGATIGGFLGTRGFLPLVVGKSASVFADRTNGGEIPLGFSVRLDRFDTRYHEDLVVEAGGDRPSGPHHAMMGAGGDAQRQEYKLQEGRTIPLTDPTSGAQYELRLLEIGSALGMNHSLRAVEDGADGEPAARLALPGGPADGVWISGHRTVFVDPDNRFKILLGGGTEGADDAASCATEGTGTFTLDTGGSSPFVVPVVAGATVALGDFEATFVEVTPSFRVGASEMDPRAYPRNPAARIQLRDPDGKAGEFLFFADPQLRAFTELPWEGVEGTFEYDFWCSPTGARVQLLIGPDGLVQAAVAGEGEALPAATEAAQGRPITHPALPGDIQLLEVLARARPVSEPVLVEDGEEGARTALRLGIAGPEGESEHWLLSNTPSGTLNAGGLAIRLEDNRARPPRDWRSHLAILEEGQVVHEGVAEVNSPVHFGGFAFFQSDADPGRPDYSGLQVVRDPAWIPVKSGLWMLLLGISWVFYVQPLMDRRQKNRRSAGREEEGGTP